MKILLSKLITLRENRIMSIGVLVPHTIVLEYPFAEVGTSILMYELTYAVLRRSIPMLESTIDKLSRSILT